MMKFFLLLFVLATAARGEASIANPRGNSKGDFGKTSFDIEYIYD